MKKIKNVARWLWKYSRVLLSIALIILSVHIIRSNNQYRKSLQFNVYQESFDLGMIPSGIIIWKHGVPGSEMNFAAADSASRYKYFDVGILTHVNVVHRVRVPFYVISMFRLGFPINFRNEKKKEEEKTPKMPQPKNNNKKNENNFQNT